MTDLNALHDEELDLLDTIEATRTDATMERFHLHDRLDAVRAAIRDAEWLRDRAAALAERRAERKLRHAA